MTIAVYKTRQEAEEAAQSLRKDGLRAALLEVKEGRLSGVTSAWHVVVPREQAEFLAGAESSAVN